jgi:hypothetical protein
MATVELTWEDVAYGESASEVPVRTCNVCGHAWVVFDVHGLDDECRPCANEEPETANPKWWRDL